MSLYVAAYDISHPGRRCLVANALLKYGYRVQRSVFELWLDVEDIPVLKRTVGPLLDPEDEFCLFPVDQRPNRRRVQWQRPPNPWGPVVLC